ncbi:hypothetical protein M569_06341 [Genlisea aurea]|uniref:Rad21/Rec8-like protein N-terminal domain-containing protein n=1 Tax=Genlisea aurea TaxID=192259 RepID=S8CMN9_9LAMI|nr:hypothetical protein M569_06341 [Genlisea aurea]
MFYSHTFLARKGPLGTVWCAAHLQNRLKKSHYLATDVISTVERIMYPEVPIALRMSGHLLLGVVRVYSKQVEYFYEDCNAMQHAINRDLRSITVNLPEASTKAPVDSVTLPGNFQLDSLEIDNNVQDRPENSHVKMLADFTLTDQIPTGNDPYIVIDISEVNKLFFSIM